MTTTQPTYDYPAYDYQYETSSTSAYPSYAGYEAGASYATHGTYDGYAASAGYPPGASTGQSYTSVDPYAGYQTAAYAYQTSATAGSVPSTSASQTSYQPTATGYTYESRRTTPPPPTSAPGHYASYEYPPGTYAAGPPPSVTYSPYKTTSSTNGSSSGSAYSAYSASAPPSHGTYGVLPGSHLSGAIGQPPTSATHVYHPPPPAAGMIPRRPEYYPPPAMSHSMHYVPQQPQSMHYRLPPRGGYQRELDEPGDENALLRHVVYVTGLPKEIQNETIADVFGGVCGEIAPVDVRSPKLKIWVYKDRQTREGKGEATITFINPESCQTAISYFDGTELFGRQIRVTLCPRRMYNMQKQNTPFNPAASSMNTTTMVKQINTNNNINTTTADGSTTPTTPAAVINTPSSTATTSTPISVTGANPIATISSSTLGLPRQLNHSSFKLRQTPEQQRGLLPTPPIHFGAPMIGSANQRDGVRKELPRIALNRGNYINPTGGRPKPY